MSEKNLIKIAGQRNERTWFLNGVFKPVTQRTLTLCENLALSKRFTYYLSWRRQWHPAPVLLSGKSHGRRSLVGCSPWGREELDTTERLHCHFSLSCIGDGNGNPLQCSCLENPRNGGAWWAAVSGVSQSRTRLKRLSSSRCYTSVFPVLIWILFSLFVSLSYY